jgi:hypothetical protein
VPRLLHREQRRTTAPTAQRFGCDMFVLCGDPEHPDASKRGDIRVDACGIPHS